MGMVPASGEPDEWLGRLECALCVYGDWRVKITRWAKKKKVDRSKPYVGILGSIDPVHHHGQ